MAVKETQNDMSDLALWPDGSKAESGAGVVLVWKKPHTQV